jgi:hypothetical protein
MIVVLFPAGGFGSTIEYCVRQFSNELTKVEAEVLTDGSMHSYKKEFHPCSVDKFLKIYDKDYEVVTPTYPNNDRMSATKTVESFKEIVGKSQKVVLIYFSSIAMAERNQLFLYHKLSSFLPNILGDKHTQWNSKYKSYKDMQIFELREALSFFIDQKYENIVDAEIIDNNWLCITPDDILYNFKDTIIKIIDYYELTLDHLQNIDEFYVDWFNKQQYILDEFNTIDNIMDSFKLGQNLSWNKLSILGEATIQSRFRQQGIEIACYNLNQFPTDMASLQQVLLLKEHNEH